MSRPTKDVIVDESYFIEALTSTNQTSSYLDEFPDNIYDTSPESRLYKFLYALLGPAGVGFLKLNYFYARLVLEEHGLQNDQLDRLYANPFKFARNFDESYLESWKGVLDSDSWNLIRALDESYRNRAIDYLHAARMGSTVEGMRLAARSALGYDCHVVENYKKAFNQNSDQILDFNLNVNTNSNGYYNLEEFTVMPNDPIFDEPITIDSEKTHLLHNAVQNLKPVNTVFGNVINQSDSSKVETELALASSEFYQVNKYVTGNSNVLWPDGQEISPEFASIYWVESGQERKVPQGHKQSSQHYQNFHRPISIASLYPSSSGSLNSSSEVTKKFPVLKNLPSKEQWGPEKALPFYNQPLTFDYYNQNTNVPFINGYPIDYLKLNEVQTSEYNPNNFWISRFGNGGSSDLSSEELTLDFGKTLGTNFLIFEILAAPIKVEILCADDVQIPISTIKGVEVNGSDYTFELNELAAGNLVNGDSISVSGITRDQKSTGVPFNNTFVVKSIDLNNKKVTVTSLVSNQSADNLTFTNSQLTKNESIYQPVTFEPFYPNNTTFDYQANSLNKWETSPYVFNMQFCRFVKIKFTRLETRYLNQSKFLVDSDNKVYDWPIVIKNLRVGRNIV